MVAPASASVRFSASKALRAWVVDVGADRAAVRVEGHLAADEDDVAGAHRLGPAVPDNRLKPWIDH